MLASSFLMSLFRCLSRMAAILTFIPNFGPILAAAPAVLLALSDGFTKAGWVIGLYLAVQTVESYFVTPLIQRRTVSLPPAFTLAVQIVAGVLAGVAGLALATPLAAAGLVLVRELYVKDTLEQPKAPSSRVTFSCSAVRIATKPQDPAE